MSAEVTDSLTKIMPRRLYDKDAVIFREGDPPSYAYIILRGKVHIAKQNGSNVALLTTLGANQMFGELALLDHKPRSATAIAAEPTEVLRITPEQFAAKMEKLDGFMKYLIGYLTDRIHDLSGRIAD